MSRMPFLHRRTGSQNWYARMMVPAALRATIGKREFIKSLGTPDRKRAELLALPLIAQWKERVNYYASNVANDLGDPGATQEGHCPSMAEIEEAALSSGYERASRNLDTLMAAKARLGPDAFQNAREKFGQRSADASRKLLAGDHSDWFDVARRLILRRNWHVPEDSPEFQALVSNLARCGVDVFRKAVAMVDNPAGEFVPSNHTLGLVTRVTERANPGEGLMDLYDRYAAQRRSEGKKRDDTLTQDRKAVESFAEFVGLTRSLRSVKASEVREWRNTMGSLPAGYKKQNAYSGMSMKVAAAYAKGREVKLVSLVTVNKNLSALSALCAWAKREGYVDANPCSGLHYDVKKRKNPRPPFDSAQLNEILQSPLFVGFECDGKEYRPGEITANDWRFWVPLICLFTGARIGEIAQLWLDDVDQQNGKWFIHIRHDQTRAQQTKSGQSRYAPIHSILKDIGFVRFVQEQRRTADRTGDPKLFPELSVNDRGQNSRASRFWRTYLERVDIKQGADGMGSHSFRHGLADQLRIAGYFDSDIEVVLGHNQSTVTSGYGKLRQGTVAKLSEMIEAAKFEGVSFKHLM